LRKAITSSDAGKAGGTRKGPAFSDFLTGALPAVTGRKMHFTGTTVLRIENGKVAEEIGLDTA
jgi:SnoaL-like polyketide cyclase